MFGRVKKWLGIEGVKLEIVVDAEIDKRQNNISGKLRFQSLNEQTVNYIKVVLIEKYARGKGTDQLIDEYELGSIELNDSFKVPANEPVEINFVLPFTIAQSKVDEFGERNIFAKGIANAAKWVRGVRSAFRLEAEAKVKGVALNPFDKKNISFK